MTRTKLGGKKSAKVFPFAKKVENICGIEAKQFTKMCLLQHLRRETG